MKDIMIATSNPNKVREFKEILEPLGFMVHDLSEIEHHEVEENGATFAQNALIKAKGVANNCSYMVIADDSGLSIDALGGMPGVYSARFLDTNDYNFKNNYILDKLKDEKNRAARFTCAIALIDEAGEHIFEGVMEGSIGQQIAGNNGFGYDPIFLPEGYKLTSAQLSPQEKNAISHRGKATSQLLDYLRSK